MAIEFRCKDHLVAKYCQEEFGARFERELARTQTVGGREQCQRVWRRRLRKEAARQQWYDWADTDEDQTDWQGTVVGKKRKLITDADGQPVLLVPEVVLDGQ